MTYFLLKSASRSRVLPTNEQQLIFIYNKITLIKKKQSYVNGSGKMLTIQLLNFDTVEIIPVLWVRSQIHTASPEPTTCKP